MVKRTLWQIGVVGVVALAAMSGCAPKKPATRPTTKPLGSPIFDGRRGGGSFPLDTKALPSSPAELMGAMEVGYRARMTGPTTQSVATVIRAKDADRLDVIEDLTVSLADWTVKKDYTPSQLRGEAEVEKSFLVHKLLYSAEPLKYEPGQMYVRLEAEDADMVILKDKHGQRALVLAGAKHGQIKFWTRVDELQKSLDSALRKGTDGTGVHVSDVGIEFTSSNPHVLGLSFSVNGTWLFMPMRLKMFGRMEVDDEMYANFAGMGATGEGPAGELIQPFLDEAMKKMEEKRSPLMVFRDGKTHATEYSVKTGEMLEMTFKFGR